MNPRTPEPQDLIIVGASGDLSRRRLLPALYNLFLDDLLPAEGQIIGYARRPMSDMAFRGLAAEAVQTYSGQALDEETWPRFAERLRFVSATEGGMAEVARRTADHARLIYLSTPPSAFAATVDVLGEQGLASGSRLVIEKPFGHDLASANALADAVQAVFDESQVFRIDHFLGKEAVQNILVLRFGNSIFERLWDRDAIEHVQITVAESIGVEGRGAFYEETGALRDIIQNHALQVLTLLTMEPPTSFEANAIRDEKVKLLQALQPLDPGAVVRGQYAGGSVSGKPVAGYREEPGVAAESPTETFVALRLSIDNSRWASVPFSLRTGKRMAKRVTEVDVSFRPPPRRFFARAEVEELEADHLTIRIQPAEGISLSFLAKEPGPALTVRPVEMDFSYSRSFNSQPGGAYERLLHAAMIGDQTLFVRADEVERAWAIVQPVLESPPPLRFYPAGSWGPAESTELIAPRRWYPQ